MVEVPPALREVCAMFDSLMEASRQEQIATAKTLARAQDKFDRIPTAHIPLPWNPINQDNEE